MRWWGRGRRAVGGDRPAVGLAGLASAVHRIAVLVGAGVAPTTALRHAGAGAGSETWARLAAAAAEPGGVARAIAVGDAGRAGVAADAGSAVEAGAWRALAATWATAEAAGAPLGEALRSLAAVLRGYADAERDIAIALAGPRATSRIVLALPAIAVAFGALLGHDALGVLLTTPIGWACLAVGGSLLAVAAWWSRRLLASAAPDAGIPGIAEALTAVAMRGGVSVSRAAAIVADAADRAGIELEPAGVEEALAVARATGAPVAELLRAQAEEARRAAVAEARERAERLGVALMLPLGAAVLPAFVVVGVVPLMIAVVGSTLATI